MFSLLDIYAHCLGTLFGLFSLCNHAGEATECASGLYVNPLVMHVMLGDANSGYPLVHALRKDFIDSMHGRVVPVYGDFYLAQNMVW